MSDHDNVTPGKKSFCLPAWVENEHEPELQLEKLKLDSLVKAVAPAKPWKFWKLAATWNNNMILPVWTAPKLENSTFRDQALSHCPSQWHAIRLSSRTWNQAGLAILSPSRTVTLSECDSHSQRWSVQAWQGHWPGPGHSGQLRLSWTTDQSWISVFQLRVAAELQKEVFPKL